MPLTPIVIEQTSKGERSYDIFSRLLKDRIVMLDDVVDERLASVLTAQLLFLESQAPEKDITLYINSPGGSVTGNTMASGTALSLGQICEVPRDVSEADAVILVRMGRAVFLSSLEPAAPTLSEPPAEPKPTKSRKPRNSKKGS